MKKILCALGAYYYKNTGSYGKIAIGAYVFGVSFWNSLLIKMLEKCMVRLYN